MPVVITDRTNNAWCAEDPKSGEMLVGLTGRKGERVLDVLEFIETRSKQFDQFIQKKIRTEDGRRTLRY